MNFYPNVTIDGLKSVEIPTFNECEHYLIEPHPGIMQTIVIKIEGGRFLTVNINPKSDNVDVQMHGEHKTQDFGDIKAYYNMNGGYPD